MDRLDKENQNSFTYGDKREFFWELTGIAEKCIFISSMTDGSYETEKQVQNIQYEDLYVTMSDK
jgi:hypothetical protein